MGEAKLIRHIDKDTTSHNPVNQVVQAHVDCVARKSRPGEMIANVESGLTEFVGYAECFLPAGS